MTSLVIFDLDGVLVDACEWHRVALNKALQEICGTEISLDDHYTTLNGLHTKEKLKIITSQGIVAAEDHAKISDRKQEITVELIKEKCPAEQTKIELITALKNKGISVACFTNSIRKTAELMLRNCGVLELLDYVVTNEDVSVPKPSSEGYLKVVSHFNVSKNNVIIIEDSPKGYAAAVSARCPVVVVINAEGVNVALFESLGVL